MHVRKIVLFVTLLLAACPAAAAALEMPAVTMGQNAPSVTAQSYVVLDADSGATLEQLHSTAPRVPASLTKLMTALVYLDTKPNLVKKVTIEKSDQVAGGCSAGGACLNTKSGTAYAAGDLLHAGLIASDNNAIAAIARSTGLSTKAFVGRMNKKAADMGLLSTHFVEPTGMSPANTTTAADYAKIVQAAMRSETVLDIVQKQSYSFRSLNGKVSHVVTSTNRLLADPDVVMVGGKTGYLEESGYNFACEIKDFFGHDFVVVVLGSSGYGASFGDVKQLAAEATAMLTFGGTSGSVLGTSTPATAGGTE